MIRFYLMGGVDPALVDFYLAADGMLIPHVASRNTTFATNIVVEPDDMGVTPAQMDIIRTLAKTQEIEISFLVI